MAAAASVEAKLMHIPSARIAAYDQSWGAGLLGDKTHSMVFDNTASKRQVPNYLATIPFHHGAAEIVAWSDNHPAEQQLDHEHDALLDTTIADYKAAAPKTP